MGQASPVVSSVASIASIGMQFYAGEQKAQADQFRAQGESQGDIYQAERLEQAAQYGELKAKQTGAVMTRNLNTTLANIDAVRAAAHTDPTSPTGAAVRNTVEAAGESQRSIVLGNIEAQTNQQKSDAAYYRTASANALLSGQMASSADMTSAYGDLFKNIAGFGGGSSSGGGLNDLIKGIGSIAGA